MSSKGQVVEVQITTGRWSLAAVVKIISGDTVNLVAFTDAVDPWPDVSTPNGLIAGSLASVAKGTGVGQWRELALPTATTDAISAAVAAALEDYATEADIATAVAAALATAASNLASAVASLSGDIAGVAAAVAVVSDDVENIDLAGLTVVAPAGTSHSGLGFNTTRQPNTTRPTRVDATGSMSLTSSLLGSQTASVELLSDSSNPPTTRRARQPSALSGVAANVTMPWHVGYDVPAGHYYKLVPAASANASCSIDDINETAG